MDAGPQWMDYLKSICALGFVAALILLLRATLKNNRFVQRLAGQGGVTSRLKLVETLYLDPRHRLVVVRHDDREHLLLLSPSGDLHIESRGAGGPDA